MAAVSDELSDDESISYSPLCTQSQPGLPSRLSPTLQTNNEHEPWDDPDWEKVSETSTTYNRNGHSFI